MKHFIAKNTDIKIFSKKIHGGMEMASVSIHEDDYNKIATYDPDDKLKPVYQDIRITVCVAGKCRGTTLEKILEDNKEI